MTMPQRSGCPHLEAVLSNAVQRCPFLATLAAKEGPAFAHAFSLNPTVPASHAAQRRPILEDLESYASTFSAFHGSHGVVPLPKHDQGTPGVLAQPAPTHAVPVVAHRTPVGPMLARGGRPLPLATLSLSAFGNMPDVGKWFRALQEQHQARKPPANKPRRLDPPSTRASGSSTLRPLSTTTSAHIPAEAGGSLCPVRKFLGPLAPLVFNPQGHIQCPDAIIKARAMLAATQPIKQLRPQALPLKLLAVGLTATAVNIPTGMWREHTEKFSASWWIAVHASIPFVAMLRKAVIMPKFVILFTIATAIAGQAIGARMERARMDKAAGTVPGHAVVAAFTPRNTTLLSQAVSEESRPGGARAGPVIFRLQKAQGKGAKRLVRPLPLAPICALATTSNSAGRQRAQGVQAPYPVSQAVEIGACMQMITAH